MQQMLDFITANPLYGVGLALLLVLLVVSLVKRAVKLVVIAVLLNVGYGYYLHDMAQTAYDRAAKTVRNAAGQVTDKAGELMQLK